MNFSSDQKNPGSPALTVPAGIMAIRPKAPGPASAREQPSDLPRHGKNARPS